jgi:hypothetical protein
MAQDTEVITEDNIQTVEDGSGGSGGGGSASANQGTDEDVVEEIQPVDPVGDPVTDVEEILDDPADDPVNDPVKQGSQDGTPTTSGSSTGEKKQKITVYGIEAGVTWQAVPNQQWLHVTDIASTEEEDSFNVSVDANPQEVDRQALVTVIPSDNSPNAVVNVLQRGQKEEVEVITLSIDPTSMSVLASGRNSIDGETWFTIDVTSNGAWTVSSPSWCVLDKTSGSGNGTVTVWPSGHTNSTSRSGSVTFSVNGTAMATCTISQDAAVQGKMKYRITNNAEYAYFFALFAEGEIPVLLSGEYFSDRIDAYDDTNYIEIDVSQISLNRPDGSMIYADYGSWVNIWITRTSGNEWFLAGGFRVIVNTSPVVTLEGKS